MRLKVIVFAAICLLLAGCMKETDDTLWLPVPYGKIPYEVLSAAEQDSLRQHMPIYEGVTPPNIVGDYLASPMTLQYASDRYEGTFYDLHWRVEKQNERNMATYKEWQRTAAGDGKEAHVIGSEDKFTAYTIEQTVDESRGWSCEQVTVISGIKTANGIEGYSYAIVMRNKQDSNGIIIDPDSYRVFTDGDGISSPVTNLKRL